MLGLNNKGFSLIELIASVAIVSIAMLGVTTLLYVASAYSQSLTEEFQALSNSYRMEYEVRKSLSLAIHVKETPSQSYHGRVRNINCPTMASCAGWQEVAYFNREDSTGDLDGTADELFIMPTWFWYKSPVHTGSKFGSESGIFAIDNGTNATGPDTAQSGAPDNNDIYFDQLAEFQSEYVNDAGVTNSAEGIQRVKIRAVFRYHGVTQVRTWCSFTDINAGNCNFAGGERANYYDNEYTFNVSLTNNLIHTSARDGTGTEVRVLGPLHFFRPIYPSGAY